MNAEHLRDYLIVPTLEYLSPEIQVTPAAVELVLGTALQESHLEFLRQLGEGPALGLWQCEPATHDDVWDNYLAFQALLASKIRGLASQHLWQQDRHGELVRNLAYACGICRVHYRRVREPLPAAGDTYAQAVYWKRYYNTERGAGTVSDYVQAWQRQAGG